MVRRLTDCSRRVRRGYAVALESNKHRVNGSRLVRRRLPRMQKRHCDLPHFNLVNAHWELLEDRDQHGSHDEQHNPTDNGCANRLAEREVEPLAERYDRRHERPQRADEQANPWNDR